MKNTRTFIIGHLSFVALLFLFTFHCSVITVPAQTTEFTYRGQTRVMNSTKDLTGEDFVGDSK